MRIGVDATCWANSRGYGRFAREIMRAMVRLGTGDEFVCFGDALSFASWSGESPNVRLVDVAMDESPTVAATSTSRRSLRDMLRLTMAVRREQPEVFFLPTSYTYFPLPPGLPGVLTIHDTIPERLPHITLPSRSARFFWNAKVRLALWQCRIVLTVSQHAARSITSVLGVDARRLRITSEAPSEAYRPTGSASHATAAARAGVPAGSRWFVYVGGFNPHKRVDVILQALAGVVGAGPASPHLVLVGARSDAFHNEAERLETMVGDLGIGHLVHWMGFVPDQELAPLVGGASALLLPSEVEGFGLPAVEAAACGTPVIATRESPLPELLAGGGIFVQPGDPGAVEAGMRQMLDPARRAALAAVALERASALSWESAARVALDAIYEAAS